MKLLLPRTLGLLLLPVALTNSAAAPASSYPNRAVVIVEPYGVGGGPDLLARAIAPELSRLWGQPVIVENQSGAGATAAPARVAKAPADGHTLLLNTSAQAYSWAARKDLSYDPLRDFIPILPLTSQPYVLVAGKSAEAHTIHELVAAAKARPGQLKFGFTGVGTGTHLGILEFNLRSGIAALALPPRQTDAISDVLAGTIEGRTAYMLAPISIALPAIHDGRLQALGVTSTVRSPLLPDVPTIAESGVAGYDFPIWYGVWAPAGTPPAVVSKLVTDIAHVRASAELRKWVTAHGGQTLTMNHSEFKQFVQSEGKRAARILEASTAQPQ